jgi:hypothetical protein
MDAQRSSVLYAQRNMDCFGWPVASVATDAKILHRIRSREKGCNCFSVDHDQGLSTRKLDEALRHRPASARDILGSARPKRPRAALVPGAAGACEVAKGSLHIPKAAQTAAGAATHPEWAWRWGGRRGSGPEDTRKVMNSEDRRTYRGRFTSQHRPAPREDDSKRARQLPLAR